MGKLVEIAEISLRLIEKVHSPHDDSKFHRGTWWDIRGRIPKRPWLSEQFRENHRVVEALATTLAQVEPQQVIQFIIAFALVRSSRWVRKGEVLHKISSKPSVFKRFRYRRIAKN